MRFLSLVGPSGLEPPTSCLSGTRSNLLSYEPMWLAVSVSFTPGFGGDDGIRTHDPLLAGQVLSQLSYTPIGFLSRISEPQEKRRISHSPLPLGLCQRCAIFPCSLPQSIFATAELNFCVRNGYRWTLCVNSTDLLSLKRKVSKETL